MTWQEHFAPFAAVFGSGFAIVLTLQPLLIWFALKRGLVDPPDWRKVHTGTVPRIGGTAFLPALLACAVLLRFVWPEYCQPHYWGLLAAMLVISLVGLWDDICDIHALTKLAFQFLCGAILFAAGYRFEAVQNPLTGAVIQLGSLDFFLTLLAVAAIINAINMLDGLDGLAAGCTFIMAAFLLVNKAGQNDLYAAAICAAVMGITAAFLIFNFHPAKVFMGDVGSIGIGALLGGVAVAARIEIVLGLIGLVFVAETVSVIAQVVSFRLCGRRVLRMAPLHHHLELSGWEETAIVVRFWVIGLGLAATGLLLVVGLVR